MTDRWALFLVVSSLVASTALAESAVQLSIATKGNELKFDNARLSVKAGQLVDLTFTNRADQQTGFLHNWVLVKPGKEKQVVSDAIQAGSSKDYIPNSPDILAHTQLVKPGKSQTIHFKAPSVPGDYSFLCTYPGHYQLLKGVLTIVP